MNAVERQVWIVGEIEAGARAGDQRFHTGYCYVLDQVGNRDFRRQVPLSALPASFTPCQICAPADRHSAGTSTQGPEQEERPTVGVQPGHAVKVENLDTGDVSTFLIARASEVRASDELSLASPGASALLGSQEGDVAEFTLPNGQRRRLRIVEFGPR